MTQYVNTLRDRTSAEYAQILPSFDGSTLSFSVKQVTPLVQATPVKMVKATIRLARPQHVEVCENDCGVVITSAVEVSFNIRQGDVAQLTSLRTELNRVIDEAVTNFQLANGLVPSGNADFAS